MIVQYAETILRVISAHDSLSSTHLSGCHLVTSLLYLDLIDAMVAVSGSSKILFASMIS